jgi:16S rRNA (uracil1498-N3)-methyltransferase
VDGAPHRSAAAQVFVARLDRPELDPDDLHHLGRVLRLRAGEPVCAADGAGSWRPTVFTGGAALDATGEVASVPRPTPGLTVAFAPVKGDRPELAVQKLTELGVDRMVVFTSARSVVRWEGDRAARHVERLSRVAREAAAQCRRLWLPTVERADLADLRGPGTVIADLGGRPPSTADHTVLVGPEGGWSDQEREARDAVTLGEHVLRAETAAIAAGALMAALRAGTLVSGPPPPR